MAEEYLLVKKTTFDRMKQNRTERKEVRDQETNTEPPSDRARGDGSSDRNRSILRSTSEEEVTTGHAPHAPTKEKDLDQVLNFLFIRISLYGKKLGFFFTGELKKK